MIAVTLLPKAFLKHLGIVLINVFLSGRKIKGFKILHNILIHRLKYLLAVLITILNLLKKLLQ